MDKRSVVFVIVLTLALFGVHYWFSAREEAKPGALQQQVKEATTSEALPRTVSLKELPVVQLFMDAQGEKLATFAVQDDLNFLTFPWTAQAPKALYWKNGNHFEKVELRIDSTKSTSPLLYSASNSTLTTIDLPMDEMYNVQLVYFVDGNQNAQVTLGEVINQQIRTPLEKLSKPAIALYKHGGKYFPCGIYKPTVVNLISFSDLPYFSPILKVQKTEISAPSFIEGEQFYVLENEYQQLVFSNIGGRLLRLTFLLKVSRIRRALSVLLNLIKSLSSTIHKPTIFQTTSSSSMIKRAKSRLPAALKNSEGIILLFVEVSSAAVAVSSCALLPGTMH